MTANSGPINLLQLPWAAQQQGEVDILDLALAEYVALRRPTARWWWGERREGRWRGAACYVCSERIVSWDTRYPITREAQAAIADHGAGHVAGGVQVVASRTPAKTAGANASTGRRSK